MGNEPEEKIQLITPGVYRKISTKNDDKPEMARIIGPAKGKPGYWQAMGSNRKQELYHEGELMSAWEPMEIYANQEHINLRKRKEHLLAGIQTLEESQNSPTRSQIEEDINRKQQEYSDNQENLTREPTLYRPVNQPPLPDSPTEFEIYQKMNGGPSAAFINEVSQPAESEQPVQLIPRRDAPSPEKQFLLDLFSKLAKGQENSDSLTVTIDIPLGFNVNKLKESILLLDLDITEVASHVVNTMLQQNRLKAAVSVALINELNRPVVKVSDRLKNIVKEAPTIREQQTTKAPIAEYSDISAATPVIEPVEEAPKAATDDAVMNMPVIGNNAAVAIDERIDDITAKTRSILERYI